VEEQVLTLLVDQIVLVAEAELQMLVETVSHQLEVQVDRDTFGHLLEEPMALVVAVLDFLQVVFHLQAVQVPDKNMVWLTHSILAALEIQDMAEAVAEDTEV